MNRLFRGTEEVGLNRQDAKSAKMRPRLQPFRFGQARQMATLPTPHLAFEFLGGSK